MALVPFDTTKPPGTLSRKEMLALGITGKIGPSTQCGFSTLGSARCGDDRPISGLYSRRRLGYNQFSGPPSAGRGVVYVQKRTYAGINPQTEQQQAWRAVFAAGFTAWKSLTPTEKAAYNVRATRRSRRGFNFFMSEYLKTHRA